MSVDRQENWLGQQRVDVPHMRSVESSICGDFDLLAGTMLAGQAPLILTGFKLVTTGITVASNLQLVVGGSTAIHYLASESGSIFGVPANRVPEVLNTTNPRVIGGFTPGQTNYVGVDFVRLADPTTVDLVQFINPNTDAETPISTPLARTIDYRINISTLDFDNSPSIAPIAIVVVDSTGAITSVQDARSRMFRLGSGGTAPNFQNAFTFAAGRNETTSADPFAGGDKAITALKQWMDAIMTRLWELGGGEFWYSPTEDYNEKLTRTGTPFSSDGEYFEWDGSNLHWKGLTWVFANSTAVTNVITDQTTSNPGQTDLADGDCLYTDVNRAVDGATLVAVKAPLATLGGSTIPGQRIVLAWRHGANIYTRDQSYFVGSAFKNATVSAAGMVKISASDSSTNFPAWVATVDSVTFQARAAGVSRGFIPGTPTPADASDFIGGSGNIIIGGGWDGADGHGGGNPVDFNLILQSSRNQDEVVVYGNSNWLTDGAAVLVIASPYADNNNQSNAVLTRWCAATNAPVGVTRRTTMKVYADGSIGFVNITDADSDRTSDNAPLVPAPVTNDKVRSKFFTRTNQLSSPNTRDQLCWQAWDGTVYVIQESNPY